MNFGEAIEALKKGERVARIGWNGRNMWIAAQYPKEYISNPIGKKFPWNASQQDLFAEDWVILDKE